jgi:malonyl-CoA O-methyltransferase
MTADSFSRAARTYHQHARVQAALAAWLAEWLPTARSGPVLEIGAGTGGFTRYLADWPGGVTATDVSSKMCALGRVAIPAADWQVMTAEKPLQGPWKGIFSNAMLQWADEPTKVFSAWRTQLAPDGRILAGLFTAGSLQEWQTVAGEEGPVTWRTADDWRVALAQSGLRVVRDAEEQRRFTHPTARDFLRSLHGVGAAPRRRFGPGALRRLLRDYEARFTGLDDNVRTTWVFYRFEAVPTD